MNERDAQVGTNGGLSQRWREQPSHQDTMPLSREAHAVLFARSICADELDAAKLRIEEALKALYGQFTANGPRVSRDAVLKIIREIL